MTIADILQTLKKHLAAELVVLLVVLAGGFVYVSRQTPQYTATAQMFASFNHNVSSGDSKDTPTPGFTQIQSESDYVTSMLGTLPTLVTTPAVLDPVIDQLKLDTTATALASRITIGTSSSYFVNIAVNDTDAQRAADIANAVGESLKTQLSDDSYSSEKTYVLSYLNLSVVKEAVAPGAPSSPNVKSFMFKMALIALVAAACVGMAIDVLDNRLRQMADLQRIADAPVLGTVMKDPEFRADKPVVVANPSGSASESIRRLALNLAFISPDRTNRSNVIVITSSGANEGKTTIAVNLAAALAENGAKVLLIDTDLRKPSVAKHLGLDGTVGLSHLLTGQVSSSEAIQQYWKPNLHILPAGEQTTNPSILINSNAMKTLLDKVSGLYDHIIVDTTPLRVANDAAVFAKDGARMLLVASQGVTIKRQLRDAVQELAMIDVTVVGSVFNQMQARKGGDDYYYYYSYSGKGKGHKGLELPSFGKDKS
ncbi:polysaccharide biosynthesis tyrosine autokinase [Bifidobacterium biavatii]|uniref:Lipopolysaccharide biosynthesis protein n=1 Tax=Bifidobacterium biavatii DSM 23969 TaxID=1437608 RepID=A0A086ZYI3_9BIFI|nr:polysaccharide biosynthesis tyrosine autokinase [Bifidobacterium biavatii]KFI51583.1 lipopolysaccharide biosynthesis protein [Bifidobacterium biavatii DSM 23969]